MATYVIGDIHGAFLGFDDVLKKCHIKKSDTLISLGDFCDGGNMTREVIDKLMTFPNLINIIGNHDFWALKWMQTGSELPVWWHQGGMRTAESYLFDFENVPKSHIDFIQNALPYYIDDQNRIFVHGGFNPDLQIEFQELDYIMWDRKLFCDYAPKHKINNYKHVFVGHTTTQHFNSTEPVTFNNLTGIDTGGGWNGKITIMDVDTFQYWQSDKNANLQNTLKRLEGLKSQTLFY